MSATKADARFAGVLYLLSGLSGVFSYIYLPAAFVVTSSSTPIGGTPGSWWHWLPSGSLYRSPTSST